MNKAIFLSLGGIACKRKRRPKNVLKLAMKNLSTCPRVTFSILQDKLNITKNELLFKFLKFFVPITLFSCSSHIISFSLFLRSCTCVQIIKSLLRKSMESHPDPCLALQNTRVAGVTEICLGYHC